VKCECGATLAVPSLGKLAKLERCDDSSELPREVSSPRASESSDWDAASGKGFLGVLLIAVGLTWAAWLLAHAPTKPAGTVMPENLQLEVDSLSPAELLAELDRLRAGIGRDSSPEVNQYLIAVRRQKFFIAASGFVIAAGAVMIFRGRLARGRSTVPNGAGLTPPEEPTA